MTLFWLHIWASPLRRAPALALVLGLLLALQGCLTVMGGAASVAGGAAGRYWFDAHHERFYKAPFPKVWQAAVNAAADGGYVMIGHWLEEGAVEVLEVYRGRPKPVWIKLQFTKLPSGVVHMEIFASDENYLPDRVTGAALAAGVDAGL